MSSSPSRRSRIKGALLGAFIGDALALGPHWFYDLDELRQHYGDWIDDYQAPLPGRYHAGQPAGASSQSGFILALTLRSLVAQAGYDEADFCRRMDDELFPLLDGSADSGPGGYTNRSIRDAWHKRQAGLDWGQVADLADTTEAAERIIAIAAWYAHDMQALAQHVSANVALTQCDPTIGAMTLAYACVLGQLIQGEKLDGELSGKLMAMVKSGQLPFQAGATDATRAVGGTTPLTAGQFATPDALLTISAIAKGVQDYGVHIDPAWKVSLIYGMPCAIYHQLPAVYHLAACFTTDFESAVLHAVNGGGQNLARAMLVGALCGAMGGIESIPTRFIDGLREHETYMALIEQSVDLL